MLSRTCAIAFSVGTVGLQSECVCCQATFVELWRTIGALAAIQNMQLFHNLCCSGVIALLHQLLCLLRLRREIVAALSTHEAHRRIRDLAMDGSRTHGAREALGMVHFAAELAERTGCRLPTRGAAWQRLREANLAQKGALLLRSVRLRAVRERGPTLPARSSGRHSLRAHARLAQERARIRGATEDFTVQRERLRASAAEGWPRGLGGTFRLHTSRTGIRPSALKDRLALHERF
mmetsp:Transcript_88223/g.248327  ORF Transcript_88223/g.248327 Transcript_88223/m.248327 type:complete len:235 (+) Transcript_88223:1138-1842(+)